MKSYSRACILGAALLLPLGAMAQGWYAGGAVGNSELDAWGGDDDTSWRIAGGYRFGPNFAVEAMYHDFGIFRRGGARAEASALSLGGVGLLPLSRQWTLFAKAGVARTDTDVRVRTPGRSVTEGDKDFSLLAAFGVGWQVTPAVEVRIDYEIVDDVKFRASRDSDIETFGIGATYRF